MNDAIRSDAPARLTTDQSVVISEVEWQAVLLGSRALREIANDLRLAGAVELAAENERSATTLEELGRRAEVAAAMEPEPEVGGEAER
jgi:hypothetical protein